MLDLRLKGLRLFDRKPMPDWGADLTGIDFGNIKYFVRSTEKQAASWDDLPADIKSTYEAVSALVIGERSVKMQHIHLLPGDGCGRFDTRSLFILILGTGPHR
jgi:Fe-S cluster assembly scaffold protein SufB